MTKRLTKASKIKRFKELQTILTAEWEEFTNNKENAGYFNMSIHLIDDFKKAFSKYYADAEEYYRLTKDLFVSHSEFEVSEECFYDMYDKYNIIPLPPFILFPNYDQCTIGWRMGGGEVYSVIYSSIINFLNKKDKQIVLDYVSNFTYPEHWDVNVAPNRYIRCGGSLLPWKNAETLKENEKNWKGTRTRV